MKRHPRLVQLSREHHVALRLGRRLLAGGAAARLGAEHDALAAHFAEEERGLRPPETLRSPPSPPPPATRGSA